MKYANRLTDEELKELYQLFTDSDATIKELNITRGDNSIAIEASELENLNQKELLQILFHLFLLMQLMENHYIIYIFHQMQ